MSSRVGSVELHPLKNVEILSTIFSFCSVKDLKNCRLVGSKLWLKASLKPWREKAVVMLKPEPERMRDEDGVICYDDLKKIYEDQQLDRSVRLQNREAWLEMEEANRKPGIFLRDLQKMYGDEKDAFQLQNKPFKKFKLDGLNDGDPELNWILENLSNQIRHLTFKNFKFSTLKSFMDTILLKLPNLAELKLENEVTFSVRPEIDDVTISAYPDHQKLKCLILQLDEFKPVFSRRFPWEKFLWKILSLQDLQIVPPVDRWTADLDERERIIGAIASIRRDDHSKLQIRSLDIMPAPLTENGFTEAENNREADFAMPLERFTGSVDDVIYLKPFAKTLELVSLHFPQKRSPERSWVDVFPAEANSDKICLPHVNEFHADGLPRLVFGNLNKVVTPKLETLVVDDVVSVSPHNFRAGWGCAKITLDNPSFGNVTRLEVYNTSRWYVINLEGFQRISQSMSNVLHAKMPLTMRAFRELCRMWPNLETLTISDSHSRYVLIDDEAITGFKPDSEPPADGERERPPNITNLMNLTKFENFSLLTDHSIYHGFLHLPQLQCLRVKFFHILEDAKSALEKKVQDLKVTTLPLWQCGYDTLE